MTEQIKSAAGPRLGSKGFSFHPGRGWRVLRRIAQVFVWAALLIGPFLGGWQRLDARHLSTWEAGGYGLPNSLATRLPEGDPAGLAYQLNLVLGGGAAGEFFEIPAVDPVAGTFALMAAGLSWRSVSGLALVVLMALVGGRVFCGFFCPFGSLARGLTKIVGRVRARPLFKVPERRPLRWGLLFAALVAAFFGVHLLMYLFLPHVLLQQSLYAMWLLGGGAGVLAVFLGLVVAGLVFGPTLYCQTLCPTGAALGLIGSRRLLRVVKEDPCPTHCDLCTRSCWLALNPAAGDPGADCDICTRCFSVCPKSNLRIGTAKRRLALPIVSAMLLLLAAPQLANAETAVKPTMLFAAETLVPTEGSADVHVGISLVDYRDVRLDADDTRTEGVIEVAIAIARGDVAAADPDGILPFRPSYDGPLTLLVFPQHGEPLRLHWDAANSPLSTQRRMLFRKRTAVDFRAGDRLQLTAVPGWFEDDLSWKLPRPGTTPSLGFFALVFLASLGLFVGLLSLALSIPEKPGAPVEIYSNE